jgi:hypothetical protein
MTTICASICAHPKAPIRLGLGGERLFKLTLEPQNFGNVARAVMQAGRDGATAAFSDAVSRAYPLSDNMKFMMGMNDE